MASVRLVERQIMRVEGFAATFRHPDGRDVRADKRQIRPYPFRRAMKNAATVEAWRRRRAREAYPQFDVDVLYRDGRRAHGRTKLGTVRDTYLDE